MLLLVHSQWEHCHWANDSCASSCVNDL